jgi:hypothetical protein
VVRETRRRRASSVRPVPSFDRVRHRNPRDGFNIHHDSIPSSIDVSLASLVRHVRRVVVVVFRLARASSVL